MIGRSRELHPIRKRIPLQTARGSGLWCVRALSDVAKRKRYVAMIAISERRGMDGGSMFQRQVAAGTQELQHDEMMMRRRNETPKWAEKLSCLFQPFLRPPVASERSASDQPHMCFITSQENKYEYVLYCTVLYCKRRREREAALLNILSARDEENIKGGKHHPVRSCFEIETG